MSFKNASQAELNRASFAWCDAQGISRSNKYAAEGARALAKGQIPYPADLSPLLGRAEAFTSSNQHIVVDLYIEGGDPADPIQSTVFFSTLEVPSNGRADANSKRVLSLDFPTVEAGSFTADIPTPEGGTTQISVYRDRVPSSATNVVWTEGPFDVPTRVVAGRDPTKRIIAQGLGEI